SLQVETELEPSWAASKGVRRCMVQRIELAQAVRVSYGQPYLAVWRCQGTSAMTRAATYGTAPYSTARRSSRSVNSPRMYRPRYAPRGATACCCQCAAVGTTGQGARCATKGS